MFCAHCGSAIKAEANFCGTCGNSVAQENTEATPSRFDSSYDDSAYPDSIYQESKYSDSAYKDTGYFDIDYEKAHKWFFKNTKFIAPIAILILGIGLGIGGFLLGQSYAGSGQILPPEDPVYDYTDDCEEEPFDNTDNPAPDNSETEENIYVSTIEFPGTPIGPGSGDYTAVEFIQTSLNEIRYYFTNIRELENTDGVFEAGTRAAVIDFQYRTGLPTTGIVNDITWRRMVEILNYPPDSSDPPFFPRANAYYVTLVNQHLRTGPSTSHESLDVIEAGTLIWVTEYISSLGWFRVVGPDELNGFMSAQFLVLDGILNQA